MTEPHAEYTNIEAVDELFMQASESDTDAITRLHDMLYASSPTEMAGWPVPVRESWQAGLDLVLETLDRGSMSNGTVSFLRAAARAGFDSPLFRDALASAARLTFTFYLDPAGMLAGLGIRDAGVPTTECATRWAMLTALEEKVVCWHPAHGMGTILDIDGISNQVQVGFARRMRMPLTMFLSSTAIVPHNTVLGQLCKGEKKWRDVTGAVSDADELMGTFLAVNPVPESALHQLLHASAVSDTQSAAFFAGPGRTAAAARAGKPAERRWDQARAIVELADLLSKQKAIGAAPEDISHLTRILGDAAARKDQATPFVESVARLWMLAGSTDWLSPILVQCEPRTIAWNDAELFVTLSDKMPGRLLPHWYGATAAIKGSPFLAELCTRLPLRLWSHVERVFAARQDVDESLLQDTVQSHLGKGDVSSDLIVWTWKSKTPFMGDLANAILLWRTLGKPVRGSFLRAHKELRKLLFDNQDFQRLITRDGNEEAINSLVRCVRHRALLNSGEQQSLLVKIVRLFPHARTLVEERQKTVARRPVGKITSARSFELRRRELQELINVKIPANSRAIAHARSYGDLRENAEYKAAKDEQAYLGARHDELEEAIHETRPTDFREVTSPKRAVPGTTITLVAENGEERAFHLLGLWDSDPAKSMLSYETPLGKVLLGAAVGDELTMPAGDDATVTAIEPVSDELKTWLAGEDLAE